MTVPCVQLPARDRDGPEADGEITRSLQDEDVLKSQGLIWLLIRWEVWSRRRASSVGAGGRRRERQRRDDRGLMCAVERRLIRRC